MHGRGLSDQQRAFYATTGWSYEKHVRNEVIRPTGRVADAGLPNAELQALSVSDRKQLGELTIAIKSDEHQRTRRAANGRAAAARHYLKEESFGCSTNVITAIARFCLD
jgi:hypothetical protein